MRRGWWIPGVLVVVFAGLWGPHSASATLLADWGIEEVIARSDLVVVGTVGTSYSYHDPTTGRLMTDTQISVEGVLLGPPMLRFVLTQAGGRDGDQTIEVVGDAKFSAGQRVLLFTYGHPDGRRYLVGMSLGAYRLPRSLGAEGGLSAEQTIDVPLAGVAGISVPPGRRTIPLDSVVRLIQEAIR